MHILVEAWEESSTKSFEGNVKEMIERTFGGIVEGMKDYNQTSYAV
jgi:hypothetical protein